MKQTKVQRVFDGSFNTFYRDISAPVRMVAQKIMNGSKIKPISVGSDRKMSVVFIHVMKKFYPQ
jgi:hypothetical protein